MMDSSPDDVREPRASIRRCAEGEGVLPGSAYADEAVYRAEAELFRRHWVSIACGQSAPEPGDAFPLRIHDQSLLLVRGKQGELRVFYNLCRHRGARLVDAPCRLSGSRIRCPYHAWSYHLDGRLAAIPHFHRAAKAGGPDADEASQLGLLPVRSAVWRDVVFVNLSGDAPPFEEVIAPLDERMAHWSAEELSPLSSDEVELQADWKLAAENFVDAYHLAVVHPEIGGGFNGALLSEDLVISSGAKMAGAKMALDRVLSRKRRRSCTRLCAGSQEGAGRGCFNTRRAARRWHARTTPLIASSASPAAARPANHPDSFDQKMG